MKYYTTIQGDTWDIISYNVYGDETLFYLIMDYNPDYVDIVLFDSGYIIEVHDLENIDTFDDDVENDRGALWQ